jgi:tetratricopeptide (TPR) repeat protein
MVSDEMSHPKVFISYSHDSAKHADRVLALSDRLRADGIDCILDQYEISPPEGFPRWMDRQIRDADFVLMICTQTYYYRVMGEEKPGKGLGVSWESNEIYQYIYDAGSSNTRFIPALPEEGSTSEIPLPWRGVKYYRAFTEQGYEELYRRLTNQPSTPKPALGKLRQLPPRERQQTFIGQMLHEHTPNPAASGARIIDTVAVDTVQVPIWNIPYARNSLFTGREEILARLHTALSAGKTTTLTQPQAISGLGGIGKTQTALEYAYRYQENYQTILWAKAESRETLLSDFVTFAHLLNLPVKEEQEQLVIVETVSRWFQEHTGWLLIFDNADDLTMVRDFLPSRGKGHTLLTTRASAIGGLAQRIEVERMEPEEGAIFLLHRAAILDRDTPLEAASKDDRVKATEISRAMDGLPLALDQAGAYIEETGCSLSDYRHLYDTRQAYLLTRRGRLATDHKDAVSTTWSLSFENIQHSSPAAADLLRLLAFLDPDVIQEEIVTKGAASLGSLLQAVAIDPIKLDEAIGALRTYSLVRRNPNRTLTIHRLVQAVLKHSLNKSTQRRWAERAVRAVNLAFPEVDYSTWVQCQQYLPHTQACALLIEEWNMTFPEAAALLMQAGEYLQQRAEYEQAEPLYQRALSISEKVEGPEHPSTASTLHQLAWLYQQQGKYEQAEPLYERALAIMEKTPGSHHPDTTIVRENYASLLKDMKK